ncbi:MAG: copper homeostasis membrane protein CopD [Sphingomonadales bacterium]|nr:copper homeostasis membrane protein CopD [Sphingomonadales bacterium]
MLIATRWALYADLGLLFGLLLFALYALDGPRRTRLLPLNRIAVALGLTGIALSGFGFLLTAAGMLGADISGVDRATLMMLLTETPVGRALLARLAALLLLVLVALAPPARRAAMPVLLAALAGVAVASLAWSGHGAAEGPFGLLPLVADIIHLLAASAWIGALGGFILIVFRRSHTHETLRAAHDALAGFATAGTVIVGLIVLTGLINSYVLLGFAHIFALGESDYGQLLLIKLALFNAMLVLAIINRFRLTPALGVARNRPEITAVIARFRRTLWLEAGAGMLILGLVGWLGTLSPPGE